MHRVFGEQRKEYLIFLKRFFFFGANFTEKVTPEMGLGGCPGVGLVDESGMTRTGHAAIERTVGGLEADEWERQARLGVTPGGLVPV